MGAVASATSASAQTTLTFNGGYYNGNAGATLPDGSYSSSENFGVYNFTVNAIDRTTANLTGLNIGSDFNSVCLSPQGLLYPGAYTYNYQSFQVAAPGLNPTGDWSDKGIQNAAYLWG